MMSSSITQRSFLRHLENFNNHVYAAYSEKNSTEVRLVLEHLRKAGLKVYDPAVERVPGKRIFYKWLENGIHKSRITLLFWSKEFKQDELCLYQSENAVLRTSLTKGRHKVICVIINNCKIPNLYKQFDCVYAWKWRENPPEALNNVLLAVLAHLEQAKRSGNLGQRTSFLIRKRGGKPSCHHKSKNSKNSVIRAMNVLLNFRKIQCVLENCVLCCQNHGCIFRCSGDNIKQFYAHVSACKFAHVQCKNIRCRQTILRGQFLKHKIRCRYKKLKCPNANCKEEFTPNELKKHKELCPHRTKCCPSVGCKEEFELKDTEEHLKHCDFVMIECDLCKTKTIRMDIEGHKQQRCPHGPAVCPHCSYTVKRMKLDSHVKKCSIQVTCDNRGCGARMAQGLLLKHKLNCPWETYPCTYPGCQYSAPKDALADHRKDCEYRQQRCEDCGSDVVIKDINWHKRCCDQMLECGACGLTIPISTKPSHDKWLCSKAALQTFCKDCHKVFSINDLEEHRKTCEPVCLMPDNPRPAAATSKPINIVKPQTSHQEAAVPPAGDQSLEYSSLNFHESGFHSMSGATSSRPGTPAQNLINFEKTALWVAIGQIPEDSTVSPPREVKQKPTERTPKPPKETQGAECDWNAFCRKKVNPSSQQMMKEINKLFYSSSPENSNTPNKFSAPGWEAISHREKKQSRFSASGRKELYDRGRYHRW